MRLRLAVLPALLCLVPACGSTVWARSRRADLTDAAHLTISGMPIGAAANVGPVTGGLLFLTGPEGDAALGRLGFGGTSTLVAGDTVLGVGLPLSRADVEHEYPAARIERNGREPPPYRRKYPTWLSVGFDAGLLLGIGARLDLAEIADLLLGLVGVDLLDDDFHARETDNGGPASPEESPSSAGDATTGPDR